MSRTIRYRSANVLSTVRPCPAPHAHGVPDRGGAPALCRPPHSLTKKRGWPVPPRVGTGPVGSRPRGRAVAPEASRRAFRDAPGRCAVVQPPGPADVGLGGSGGAGRGARRAAGKFVSTWPDPGCPWRPTGRHRLLRGSGSERPLRSTIGTGPGHPVAREAPEVFFHAGLTERQTAGAVPAERHLFLAGAAHPAVPGCAYLPLLALESGHAVLSRVYSTDVSTVARMVSPASEKSRMTTPLGLP